MVGGDLLNRLATTDRLHGDLGFELRTVGAALAQLLRRRLHRRWEPLSGAVRASEVHDGCSLEKPDRLSGGKKKENLVIRVPIFPSKRRGWPTADAL